MNPSVPEGLTVRVSHLRRFEDEAGWISRRVIADRPPLPKGGMTIVKLIEDEEVIGSGIAVCSDMDNFSRTIGRLIATGRALKAANLACRF